MSPIVKYLLLPFTLTLFLFTGLLYINNHTTMFVSMKSNDGKRLSPQVYFASNDQPGYRESNSAKGHITHTGEYSFDLPSLKKITYLRFDPAMRKTVIHLTKITIVTDHWFTQNYYTISLDNISPAFQVDHFHKNDQQITFMTTGKDPQLNIRFTPKHIAHYHQYHIDLFLIAFLIYLFSAYIWHLYHTRPMDNALSAKMILYALFFALMLFKTLYYKDHVRFSYPPDELAHLSYIAHVHKQHHFIPDYQHMTMINNPHSGNYLSHPPLYYELMNLVYDNHLSARGNVEHFRTFSMLLFVLGFMLILYIGFRADLTILGDFVFLTLLTSVPMFAYIGASISNDTLAILGAVIFVLGLQKLIEQNYHTSTYLLIALGTLIAYFSKLTAAILLFFAGVYFLFYMIFTKQWIKISKLQWLMLCVTLLPIVYYQIMILLEYHAMVPTFNVTHPQEYLHSGFFVPETLRQHLSHYEWFERMLHYIQSGWFGIHSHHSFGHATWYGVAGLLILHLLAIIAFFLPCKKEHHAFCLVGKLTLLALFSVLVVQYFFSYKAHLYSGYLGGLQPRYLLPFMFSFAIMASIFVERFSKVFMFNILIIFICLHALYADFFYFLQYYQ